MHTQRKVVNCHTQCMGLLTHPVTVIWLLRCVSKPPSKISTLIWFIILHTHLAWSFCNHPLSIPIYIIMALMLAPYNGAMRLGMGFNSYTQTLCVNDVVRKPGNIPAAETDLRAAQLTQKTDAATFKSKQITAGTQQ